MILNEASFICFQSFKKIADKNDPGILPDSPGSILQSKQKVCQTVIITSGVDIEYSYSKSIGLDSCKLRTCIQSPRNSDHHYFRTVPLRLVKIDMGTYIHDTNCSFHIDLSSAKFNNEWSCTSAPPVCFCFIDRNSTFSFTFCEAEAVNSVDVIQNDPQLYLLQQTSIQPSLSHISYWHIAYLACCCHVSNSTTHACHCLSLC